MDVNRRLGAGVFLLALACHTANAAASTPNERALKQFIDERDHTQPSLRQGELPAPPALPDAAAPSPSAGAESGPCFPIQHIHLTPTTLLPAARVAALTAPFLGRCLHSHDLAALQNTLNSVALAQGWVTTRAVIPEQNLSSGLLQLHWLVGRVSAMHAPALGVHELVQAAPMQVGEVLQLRALEQTLSNLNRLASWQASMTLRPGAAAGDSEVDFTVARAAPWQAALLWQSDGIGGDAPTQSLRATATQDSPLHLADRLVLGLNATLADGQVDDAHGASVDYDIPAGWWSLRAGADRFDYQNAVHTGLSTFLASGSSRAWRGEVARLAYRNTRDTLTVVLHGKQRSNRNLVAGVLVGVSSNQISAFGLRAEFSRVAAPWVLDALLSADAGRASTPTPHPILSPQYRRVSANSRLQYHFARATVSASATAQWSGHRLAPSEQFTLTSHAAGFAPLSLNTPQGGAARLEAAWPVAVNRAGFAQLQPSVALAWASAAQVSGQAGAVRIGALEFAATQDWRLPHTRVLLRLSAGVPLAALSTIAPAQSWLGAASVSAAW